MRRTRPGNTAAEAQGQGLGRALTAAPCEGADGCCEVLRIELVPFVDHGRAIAHCQQQGLRQEGGQVVDALRDEAQADVLSLARLHHAPPPDGRGWPAPAAR